jgi:hypothetical protein
MRDQGTGGAVGDEYGTGSGEDRGLEPRDPVAAPGMFPVVLHDTTELRVEGFPTTLPVIGS